MARLKQTPSTPPEVVLQFPGCVSYLLHPPIGLCIQLGYNDIAARTPNLPELFQQAVSTWFTNPERIEVTTVRAIL